MVYASCAFAIDGPLTPEESLKYLKTEPGLKVELVAAEPVVVDPVAVAWDEKGRMFVVEDRGYPTGPGKGKPPMGQVVLLEDTKGDGKYDKRTVFADGLTFPNGVMPWNGGVYVTCAPYVYYFKDTNDDGVADIKQVVFKGFQDLSTTQLRVSHPTLNIDNWVYLTSGLTAAKVTSPAHPDRPLVFLNRVDGRFRPGTEALEPTSGTAQFGQTFDRFGRKFICSNRNHIQQVVMPLEYLRRNPNLSFSSQVEDIPDHEAACRVYPLSANITTAAAHTGFITSACGVTIYNGDALPESYRGNSFTCEPAGNLVHHDVLVTNGVAYVAKRAYPTNEFLASPDNWFRAVNLANGPDGALYVCDMYRKTIEHPDYLPEAVRKGTDFESGKGMGRIYRVVAERRPKDSEAKATRKIDLGKMGVKELVGQFENPNIWWRMTAQRLLLERQDKNAVPLLSSACKSGKTPEARVHALRTLEGLNALDDAEIQAALEDKDAGVREHGLLLAEPRLSGAPELAAGVMRLADDPDARVRFQCALTLGDWDDDKIVRYLAKIAVRGMEDKWTRAATLSAISKREEPFLRELLAEVAKDSPSGSGMQAMMAELGHILAAAEAEAKLPDVLERILNVKNGAARAWQMAAVSGFGDGLRARQDGIDKQWSLMKVCEGEGSHLRGAVEGLFERSAQIAGDDKATLNSRLPAIGLLGQANNALAGATLEKLLGPQQPSEIQTASIRALSELPDANPAPALLTRERWNAYTPAVRDVALSVLMGSTNSMHALLEAVQKGDVPAYTVNGDRRGLMMRHKDESIKEQATALFKNVTPGDRMKVYEQSKAVLELQGASKNGHAVFQKNCTACHVFAGEGHTVGPDLTGIRNQPKDVLLLHIVVPEYEIMPIYTCYNVETKDGQNYTGLLAGETPNSITLRMAQALDQNIPRANIASMNTSRLSLMPQELEKAMTTQELADLLAFLKGE
ncbi:MAG TPA: PVC-type heme-binding CxxCH protein [Candidatus Dormibacteraeota bacterium]|nr:PVC-type heme-binding CxxCH protein [Candidatus Dormibacteraeota bacterium]